MKKLMSLLVVVASVTIGAWGCGRRGEPVDDYEPPAPPPPPGVQAPAQPGGQTAPAGQTPAGQTPAGQTPAAPSSGG